jgi:hypothetical protein
MRFALTADHREFFSKNNYIELEGIIPSDQIASLKKSVDETLAIRLRLPAVKVADRPPLDLFQAGYDLWRDS